MLSMFLLVILLFVLRWAAPARQPRKLFVHRTRAAIARSDPVHDASAVRSQRKPPWVVHALIRLKALSPDLGCRVIAEVFNRQFADRRVSVSKSYVAAVLRRHHSDIAYLRRTLKHRVPHDSSVNRTWAMDLTGKTDIDGRTHLILGVIDHGSRAVLKLAALSDKRSLTLLRELVGVFRRFGLPRRIRVDNEACFVSRTMQIGLGLLGVKLQRIRPHCPWQNGRIERFFGTLKEKLDRIAVRNSDELRSKLISFRCWYNHARPHQHLRGRTPAEVWDGRGKATGRPWRFSAWEGRLIGWVFSP